MDKSEQILDLILEMKSDMNEMKSDMNEMNIRMENSFETVYSEINGIKSDISVMKSDIAETKSDIKNVQTTLEIVTNKNINIIAEGHRDLSNKFDQALKIENEKEILLIRLNILENEVNRIKTRLEEIA